MNSSGVVPQPKLRPVVFVAGGILVAALGAGIYYGPGLLWLLPLPEFPGLPTAPAAVEIVQLPEEFSRPTTRQAAAAGPQAQTGAHRPHETATQTATAAQTVAATEPSPGTNGAAPGKSIWQQMNPFDPFLTPSKMPEQTQGGTQGHAKEPQQAAQPPPQTPKSPAEKPAPRRWDALAKPKDGGKREAQAPMTEAAATAVVTSRQRAERGNAAQNLIQPAQWAIPEDPLRTIYQSMTLNGELLHAVNSDIPGQFNIVLTTPVFDKFGYGVEILPKGSLVIARQVGRPDYNSKRLQIELRQIEMPSGEVIGLKATVGDEDGTNGLTGKVNNHYGKLILATALSALLNIGVKSAAGTPGENQNFRNPIQDAAQDIGNDVQRTAQGVVDRELRVPPTITRKAMTFCMIKLDENIQFNRPPLVAR